MIEREKVKSIVEELLSTSRPYLIYKEFIDFFGEDKVDFQNRSTNPICISSVVDYLMTTVLKNKELSDRDLKSLIKSGLTNIGYFHGGIIIIRWPEVKITNEKDQSVTIKELYARVAVNEDGTMSGGFSLNRADYPITHLLSNYMHSHVRSIPIGNFTEFQGCCLGDGPIRNTISNLNYFYDIDKWKLFCLELDRYVHVESLRGGPYHRMRDIFPDEERTIFNALPELVPTYDFRLPHELATSRSDNYQFIDTITEKFLDFLIKSRLLSFQFSNGCYKINKPPKELLLSITDAFIDWYNITVNSLPSELQKSFEWLLANKFLYKAYEDGSWFSIKRVVNSRSSSNDIESYITSYNNKLVTFFKGNEIRTHIYRTARTENSNEPDNYFILLNPEYVSALLTKITRFVNSKNLN